MELKKTNHKIIYFLDFKIKNLSIVCRWSMETKYFYILGLKFFLKFDNSMGLLEFNFLYFYFAIWYDRNKRSSK
jgi:hypothetical protein